MDNAAAVNAIDPDIRRQAIEWYVLLNSGEATAAEHEDCKNWLASHPQHTKAWSRLDSVRNVLVGAPGNIVIPALTQGGIHRRSLLKGVALLALGLGGGTFAWRGQPWNRYVADFKTRVGEQHQFTLSDGSQLLLNTDTQVALRFGEQSRMLQLLRGEVQIQTATATNESRPFEIETIHGCIRALGTRFIVREQQDFTQVAVLEHAVEIRLPNTTIPVRLEAGQQLRFNRDGTDSQQPVSASTDAWVHGQLAVNDQPLGEVINELARYRPGFLRISPKASAIRVSGVFPVRDTDRTLEMLASRFPIHMNTTNPYWVSIDLE